MSTPDNQVLKDAQYRKTLSIAFFNSVNSAIEMVKFEAGQIVEKKVPAKGAKKVQKKSVFSLEGRLEHWRDYFLNQHQVYYSNQIANIGANYKAETTIEFLKEAKTYAELKTKWISISEDERRDGEVIKVVKEIKKKLNENV